MKTYFITGANRGLGLGLVTELVKDTNNKVIVTVRKSASIEDLEALGSKNLSIIYCDIVNESEIDSAFEELAKITDTIDVAILNAAFVHQDTRNPLQLTENAESWKDFIDATNQSIEINGYSQIYITNKLIPFVEKSQEKKIFHVSSGFGDDEFVEKSRIDTAIPYSISKAVTNMIVAKYTDIAKTKGLTIIALCPGVVNTYGVTDEVADGLMESFKHGFRRVNEDYIGVQNVETASKKLLKAVEFYGSFQSGKIFSTNGSEHISA
ncbi:uncharacterized oxidoreductase [[Candida] jaroonii]|uniref:Uncharacterized oxidoreductase n=1 Tax=[Candida] jaroonii TaxID=467808 RepID=A0ACA9YER7_9ASCO|nr:uncharacterized oxidoreductase [[Candida] jaroonii]